MEIKSRLYPYPILSSFTDDYIASSFSVEVDVTRQGYDLILDFESQLENTNLLSLMDKGHVAFGFHLECPQTKYRKIHITKDFNHKVQLNESIVNGILQICPFVVAMKDIGKFSSNDFSDDFKGYDFSVERGCKLAIGNQIDVRVEKVKDDLADTPSIFTIIKSKDIDRMVVDIYRPKIEIKLPEIEFNIYKTMVATSDVSHIFHSMMIVPSLMVTIDKLKQDNDQFYDFENYRWFIALRKILLSLNIDIEKGGLENKESLDLAQMLLNSPLKRGFDALISRGEVDDDDY